ncbi:MAG: hypothetical protein DMG08_02655 [Acidobacteria bacterium]|nr:MAG: hypothetical protein DMG08_02655 [Acidobacteriota bacterium]
MKGFGAGPFRFQEGKSLEEINRKSVIGARGSFSWTRSKKFTSKSNMPSQAGPPALRQRPRARFPAAKRRNTMNWSRRDLCLILPALVATRTQAAEQKPLSSKVVRFEDLPVKSSDGNRFRAILKGATHDGHKLEAHATELAPGSMPHPPHRHKHEEMFLLREGAVQLTVAGRTTQLGPGGVAFIASNDEHGIKNLGSTPAQYFVIALGADA